MYEVQMFFGGDRMDDKNWFTYGVYETRNEANEAARQIAKDRGCDTIIEKK